MSRRYHYRFELINHLGFKKRLQDRIFESSKILKIIYEVILILMYGNENLENFKNYYMYHKIKH